MAKITDNIESKSLAPEGLEDKALAPVDAEIKAVAPSADDKVQVIVAHPIPAGRIGNNEDLNPGDKTSVTKVYARQLVQQGVVRLA